MIASKTFCWVIGDQPSTAYQTGEALLILREMADFSRNESANYNRSKDRVVAVTCAELSRFITLQGRRVDYYQIGENEVYNLKLLAQIVKVEATQHHVKYMLDDKTGAVIAARYLTDDESDSSFLNLVKDGMYVHAYGKLHSFSGDVYIELQSPLRPITHIDQISAHTLKVVYDHYKLLNLGNQTVANGSSMAVATQIENGYRVTASGSQPGNSSKKVSGGYVADDGAATKAGEKQAAVSRNITTHTNVMPAVTLTAPSTPTKKQPLASVVTTPNPSPARVLAHDVLRLPADAETTRSMTPDERTLYRHLLTFRDSNPELCTMHHLMDDAAPKLGWSTPTLMRAMSSLLERSLIEEKSTAASEGRSGPPTKFFCIK